MSWMSKDGKLRKLGDQPLFARCRLSELARVGRVAEEVQIRRGSIVSVRGREVHEFVIVAEGSAHVLVDDRPVATIGAGAWLGDRELLTRRPSEFDVVAISPMTLFVVPERSFLGLVEDVPLVARRLLTALADRVPELNGSSSIHPSTLPTNARMVPGRPTGRTGDSVVLVPSQAAL